MSEEILKALMQLFGLIAKQDGGAGSNEAEYVRNFLEQQLNAEAVEEYFTFFLEHASDERVAKNGEEETKVQLTSVKDSVRTLGICKKSNKQLNREQKVVVLVRLYELVNADRKFTDQRMAIINTVAEVFKFSKGSYYYKKVIDHQAVVIKQKIKDIASTRVRYGYEGSIFCYYEKEYKSITSESIVFINY